MTFQSRHYCILLVDTSNFDAASLHSEFADSLQVSRDRYSNRAENFKQPKNREDSSDLDENLTESIAAMRSIISEIFGAARLQKNCFQKFCSRELLFEYLSLILAIFLKMFGPI